MQNKTCPVCGVEFAPTRKNQVCCSVECQRRRKRRLAHVNYKRKFLSGSDAIKAISPVSVDTIMHARRKPAGVSDVRWRMELRRRAMTERYAYALPPRAARMF